MKRNSNEHQILMRFMADMPVGTITLKRRRIRKKRRRGKIGPESDLRTRNFEKGRSLVKITQVVEAVASIFLMDGKSILLKSKREDRNAGEARTFAMALCQANGVPCCHVARAFNRTWQTAYAAEIKSSKHYRDNPDFRKKWDRAYKQTQSIRNGHV